jgi:hypothetical protein
MMRFAAFTGKNGTGCKPGCLTAIETGAADAPVFFLLPSFPPNVPHDFERASGSQMIGNFQ